MFDPKVLTGGLLAALFADLAPEHTAHVALRLAEAFGGPASYSEALERPLLSRVAVCRDRTRSRPRNSRCRSGRG
ncbi:hypothetical protein C3488_28085 [Streptomyces sp. Ru72]|nr:hypothetical protein C3488_28085 [Streptomyces sp. Ru72]